MKLWLNGALCNEDAAWIEPADRGFTLGDGVFETIRVAAQKPLRLLQHLQRLRCGAECLQIPLRYDTASITAAIAATLAANDLPNAALRLTLSRGPARRGLLPPDAARPTLLITCAPPPPPPLPACAVISRTTCRNQASPLSRIKSLNYLDNILALQEAVKRGADEAILCNTRGQTACASAANIFVIHEGKILTPPVGDGALPGIMRGAILARFGAVETTLDPEDLQTADAIFLSNALGLRPLARIDQTNLDVHHPRLREMIAWAEHFCE